MMPSARASADAANDAYNDRPKSQVNSDKRILLDGQNYQVFGYKENFATGFHATAYREVAPPHGIIIAYRGTDPDYKQHTRTVMQDAAVDFTMVKDQTNRQKPDADAFTQAMIDKAEKNGISREHVTVAGHSLGGTFVELEASKFHLRGASFNGFGAVDLGYGVHEGGNQVTNYVMAGDVVSAGSHHFGEVKILASEEDITALHSGRYLNPAPGAPPPNPLLAMKLSDHSVTHFTGGGGKENVLAPANIVANETRYTQNRAAINRFREDVHQDRAELGAALRHADGGTILTTLAYMPPHLQQQLMELHAANVDAPIRQAVEHNPVMQGAEKALDHTTAALRTSAERVQQNADELSHAVRTAGHGIQHRADEVAHASLDFSATSPVAAASVALGATAFGYAARAEAESIAQASHIAGKVTYAAGQFAADRMHGARELLEGGANGVAQLVTNAVHVQELEAVVVVDATLLTAHAGRALSDGVTRAYGETREVFLQGVASTKQVADNVYSALGHTDQAFKKPSAPAHASLQQQSRAQSTQLSGATHALDDPRHPENHNHRLYNEIQRRIPDASERRLLQFADACHSNGITAENLGQIHLDKQGGRVLFTTSWPPQPAVVVDIKTPSPEPQQSIQHIQQHDRQQAQTTGQINAQGVHANPQLPTPGAPHAPTR